MNYSSEVYYCIFCIGDVKVLLHSTLCTDPITGFSPYNVKPYEIVFE